MLFCCTIRIQHSSSELATHVRLKGWEEPICLVDHLGDPPRMTSVTLALHPHLSLERRTATHHLDAGRLIAEVAQPPGQRLGNGPLRFVGNLDVSHRVVCVSGLEQLVHLSGLLAGVLCKLCGGDLSAGKGGWMLRGLTPPCNSAGAGK